MLTNNRFKINFKNSFLVLNEISSIKCVCIKLSSANKVVIIFVEKKTTFTEKSY